MNRQSNMNGGFSLIEVLVTMLVIAIGLLGVVALQFRGLQYSHDAYLRSQVNILAYDMADRMRLNRDNAANYPGQVTNYIVPAARPGGCAVTGAGSTGDVINDAACWKQQLYDAMPPGSTANIIAGANNLYTIQLQWTDRDGTQHPVTFTFQP